jgi:hypothetical protein
VLELERSHNSTWLREFYRFRRWATARPHLRRCGGTILVVGVLLTPSIWMLSVIPPLWNGIDAYVQVTYPPGPGTILQWGPLYCFVARIPLYVGYAIDCLRARAPFPTPVFLVHPILSDSGVFVLLLSQHVALCCSALYLIALTTRLFWVRLILAIAWAANPLFYTFAHQVGSDTLSMILILLAAGMGLKIVQHSQTFPRKEWLLFGILLWLCILTRHINASLAALMPLTFILLGGYRLIAMLFIRSQRLGLWQRLAVRQTLEKAIVAITVGISGIVLANVSLRILCRADQIPYYSTVGFTFLFRLTFLAELSPEKRNQLLDEVNNHTASADVKEMIRLVRDAFPGDTPKWDPMAFMQKARLSLFPPQTDPQGEKFYHALNRTEQAFLYSPPKVFLSAVAADFKTSQEVTIPSVVRRLFNSTAFYFLYPKLMPDFAALCSFRDKSTAQIIAVFKKHGYFRRPKGLSYSALLVLWVVNLALLVALARMRKEEVATVSSYAAALTLVGLFMMLANCVLNGFLPRYTLPMWELTIVSASVLFGKTIECLFSPPTPPIARVIVNANHGIM